MSDQQFTIMQEKHSHISEAATSFPLKKTQTNSFDQLINSSSNHCSSNLDVFTAI